jgi:putative peptide zinc metalloprotease protein
MQALFSEHWHSVSHLRPHLRSDITALHRILRGKPWVLLFDPASQRFHRITPTLWRVLEQFDGQRTLEQIWQHACTQTNHGGATDKHEALSQTELVNLLSSLHGNDLLQTQAVPDALEMQQRHKRQRRARLKQSILNPMSMKLPLFYPDAWFERQARLSKLLFSLPVLFFWLVLVLPALVLAWQHWEGLTNNLSNRVLSASNLVLLWFIYPLVKAVHEWAHGAAIKAWGGHVREIGVMLVVFTPVPYVDASAAYRFPSKWARATVSAAGIMAELALGAIALYVWLLAEPGLVSAVAFNTVLIAGVSTLLVNGNPLMRFDAYFILCDLAELPNLAQRANQYLVYLVDRYLYAVTDAKPPFESKGERKILLLYGLVAPLYRLTVTIGLIWFVATEYMLAGAIMALITIWSALLQPLWRGWQHLSELAKRREWVMRRTWLGLAALVIVLGGIPLPFHSVHQAVVWLPDQAIVRAGVSGQVVATQAGRGQQLHRGKPILTLDNPSLAAELAITTAAVSQIEVQLRKAQAENSARVASLKAELLSRNVRMKEIERQASALQIDAELDGQWMPVATTELTGRYLKRGDIVGYVVPGPSRMVRVAVTQDDMALIRNHLKTIEVRLENSPQTVFLATMQRQVPGAESELVSAALGTSGGGEIAVAPDQKGTHALQRVFDLELVLQGNAPANVFGDRAQVRFDLGRTPLIWQWLLRLRQVFLAQLNV